MSRTIRAGHVLSAFPGRPRRIGSRIRGAGTKLSYGDVFKAIAFDISVLPIVGMSLLFSGLVVFALAIVTVAIFPWLPSLPVWNFLPFWAWMLIGAVGFIVAVALLDAARARDPAHGAAPGRG